jgi:putative transposase
MAAYQIAERKDSRALAEFLQKEGQFLLPMVQLVEQAQLAVDEVIQVTGRATLEAVLQLSAQQVAGPKHPGKAAGDIRWHGEQNGIVPLSNCKVRVRKPRLRRKGVTTGGEVEVPAYAALRTNSSLATKMLSILMRGVSTRNYQAVLPDMAESVGVSRSSVSRQMIEASAEALKAVMERRFDDKDLLVIYLDGLRKGGYHVIVAVGVDSEGHKQVLGLREGASENAQVVKDLLEDLVARGVQPGRQRLFVIDGAKALRQAIDSVFGASNPVQRCRLHKERNLAGYLPKDELKKLLKTMKLAWRLPAEEGQAKLQREAQRLDKEYPSAADSLREGLHEMFTVNRLGLPSPLARCLTSTNVIESSFSGSRGRTRRVTHWQSGEMVLRWSAAALLETEKNYRKVMGHEYLKLLKAHLDQAQQQNQRAIA